MAINKVKLTNFKKFENLEVLLDGKNTFVVGDIGAGKSTLLDAIMMSNMQMDWPSEVPLTEGKESGSVEVER